MRAARVDENQVAIVAALRKAGATVQHLHKVGAGCPDLLVGFKCENYLIECKLPGKSPNKLQKEWHAGWRGNSFIAHTPEAALWAIGVTK